MVVLNVLGLNSGTSMDAIDISLCQIESNLSVGDVTIQLLSYHEIPFSTDLRSRVLNLTRPGAATTLEDVCDLNFALGEEFTRAIIESGVDLSKVDVVASHGQTLWHTPTGSRKSTLQMAESSVISHATEKTVVSDFRVAEVAAGRQGAPLTGFFEAGILLHPHLSRVSQNIGGIGNATYVPASGSAAARKLQSTYVAFDTGPGNVLIDAAVRYLSSGRRHYDHDGKAGARGEDSIDNLTVEEFLESPYFKQTLPKTTGREYFSDDMARGLVQKLQAKGLSDDAIIATLTRITAESIARAYEDFLIPHFGAIDEIYLCGGGAYNPNITKHLKSRFPQAQILRLDEAGMGVSAAAKEAVMFALLGFLSLCGRCMPISGLAETNKPAILGKISPGANYHDLMRKVVEDAGFSGAAPLGSITMK